MTNNNNGPKQIQGGMRVEAYRNLHTGTYSVRDIEYSHKVIGHPESVIIINADLVSQPAGRNKVRETGVKNVHAFVRGRLVYDQAEVDLLPMLIAANRNRVLQDETIVEKTPITYNPYKNDSFVNAITGEPIHTAQVVVLNTDGPSYAIGANSPARLNYTGFKYDGWLVY